MRSTGSPVISATRAGGYAWMRSRNASQPSVCASMNSRSSAPRATTTCSSPSASAASVPGLGARCSSASIRAARADRIDHDHVRALAAGGLHELPDVMVRDERIGAPEDDERGVGDALGVHADAVVAEGIAGGEAPRAHADGEMMLGGAEDVPEAPAGARQPLDHPEGAGPVVRPDGLGPVALDDRPPAGRDLAQRLVPGDPREAPLALLPGAAHGPQEPIGLARVLEVAVHLLAQGAARIGVLAVAQELDRAAVLHGDDPATGVGAVERADAVHVARGRRRGGGKRLMSGHAGILSGR